MLNQSKFYIDGEWVAPIAATSCSVVNPANEEVLTQISLGSVADADRAVAVAKAAFPSFSQTSKDERLALLQKIHDCFTARYDEMVQTIVSEVGAPIGLTQKFQARLGLLLLADTISVLKSYTFDENQGKTLLTREPIGVCALITPWNWPINQIACKVYSALAAGCTMVLKPSEVAPLNAILFAEILHEAGVPKGVFNLVNGDGATVGQRLASHSDVDMVSFTGSTRGGIAVAKAAADTVKRVVQELGGKSPNIILPDADLKRAVTSGVYACFMNSGQSCNAPTRMFVHTSQYDQAIEIAKSVAQTIKVGDPKALDTVMGPLVSETQWLRVQHCIQVGIDEGAQLATGGLGRPEGLQKGYFVKPTIFSHVKPQMIIAREEIFGPVLCIIPYETEKHAIAMANDTPYGLAALVHSGNPDSARRVARQLRAGNVQLNNGRLELGAPFGGYKQSGNGRERGRFGLEEFLETKAIAGYEA